MAILILKIFNNNNLARFCANFMKIGLVTPAITSRGVDISPPEAEAFFVKLHIIFALKYNKQQLLLLLDKIHLC